MRATGRVACHHGSTGYRLRLWKAELARLADELGIAVTVVHMPPVHAERDTATYPRGIKIPAARCGS